MAGHSKWHNIKHRKAAVDKKRGKAWTKCAKAIIVAAKHGGPDPASNLSLRYAIDLARYANMPRDTIDRAIKKGAGELGAETYESIRYEGYGPAGVAILIDALTDNRTRTVGDLRLILGKFGGNLGSSGCVAYLFENKGQILISSAAPEQEKKKPSPAPFSEERLMELAIEAGAEDVESPEAPEAPWTVTTAPADFHRVKERLEAAGFVIDDAQFEMLPTTRAAARGDDAKRLLSLVDAVEDLDDVQKVYTNVDLADADVPDLA
ncbi:MAG: YebC/PmpR family DNA-binding transcriptional regulator [Phycisphaerales bacterium]